MGLIFDLDGVLISTVRYHFMAWKKIADELGLRFSVQDNELLKGVSRMKSFEIILELNGISMTPEEKQFWCERKNGFYIDFISTVTPADLLPGALDFLLQARELGFKIALGSASKNSRLVLKNSGIENLFDCIVDGNMVSLPKPDSDVFLKGAQLLGLLPEECAVFEDSAAGIMAARNGKIPVIGVGNYEIREMADYFISGFDAVDPQLIINKLQRGSYV